MDDGGGAESLLRSSPWRCAWVSPRSQTDHPRASLALSFPGLALLEFRPVGIQRNKADADRKERKGARSVYVCRKKRRKAGRRGKQGDMEGQGARAKSSSAQMTGITAGAQGQNVMLYDLFVTSERTLRYRRVGKDVSACQVRFES